MVTHYFLWVYNAIIEYSKPRAKTKMLTQNFTILMQYLLFHLSCWIHGYYYSIQSDFPLLSLMLLFIFFIFIFSIIVVYSVLSIYYYTAKLNAQISECLTIGTIFGLDFLEPPRIWALEPIKLTWRVCQHCLGSTLSMRWDFYSLAS